MKNIATSIRTLNIQDQQMGDQDEDRPHNYMMCLNKPQVQSIDEQPDKYQSLDIDQHSSLVDPGNVMGNIGNQTTSMN